MQIPFRNITRRRLFVLIFALAAAALTSFWAFAWPDTYSPVALIDMGRAALMQCSPDQFERYVEADAAPVLKVARDIELLEPVPARRPYLLCLIPSLLHYRFDYEVWGRFYRVSSPTELDRIRAEHGWPALRGDCKAQAIFTASVAKRIGVPYRFGHGPRHMWVEVRTAEGWLAINRQGRKSTAVRDMDVGDWHRDFSDADRSAFAEALREDAARDAAALRLFVPAPDPEGMAHHRDPEVRDSVWNSRVIPTSASMAVLFAILLVDDWLERRRRRACPAIH